jgi:phosphoenolpyruvate carboxykinase (ATP)
MYQFISGYTAKVAGTESGITEPKPAFSACFNAPFMPLHPGKYAQMLGNKMQEHKVNVWLINTGWTGGPYGIGKRINITYTRAMITAAIEGKLNTIAFDIHPVFGISAPKECPGVPAEILNPRNTWNDTAAYDEKAKYLGGLFIKNFEKYKDRVSEEVLMASPKI